MKFKVLKHVVHGQKLHAPAEKGKPATIIEVKDEHMKETEKHWDDLVENGVLEPVASAKPQEGK